MRILVWHGKYGDSYYDASTHEAREASARKILKEWTDPNYPWLPAPEDPMKHIQYSGIDLEQASLTDEQIEALPTEGLRAEARKHKRSLERRVQNYANELEDYDFIQKVVAGEPSSVTAWQLVQQYGGDEYMEVSEESVEEANGD